MRFDADRVHTRRRGTQNPFVLFADGIHPDDCSARKSATIDTLEVAVAGAGWP